MNFTGPPIFFRYNRENLCIKLSFGTKMHSFFVRYERKFVITVIILNEFDCSGPRKVIKSINGKF